MRTTFILLTLATLAGCAVEAPPATPPSTASAPGDSAAPSAESTPENAEETIVIDVRSKSEWDSGHVERAFHIPHTEIAERISEVTSDKDAKIVLYCAVGGRAGKAKTTLENLGFTNVENAGGYDDVKDRY